MHSKIIIDAFEKATEELEIKGVTYPSKNKVSKFFEEYFNQNIGFSYSYKSFCDLKSKVDSGGKNVIIKQAEVIQGLCKYLGYKNYEDFVLNNTVKKKEDENDKDIYILPIDDVNAQTIKNSVQKVSVKVKIIIFISIIIPVVFIINSSLNQQRWMVWQESHYVEVKFDDQKYDIGELKLYKEERIKDFKKILPDCNTFFFNTDGTVKVWYGKNEKKELEYFTALGLHPETGKTLKAITPYMIKNHICEEYH